jgi:hypothetical protein
MRRRWLHHGTQVVLKVLPMWDRCCPPHRWSPRRRPALFGDLDTSMILSALLKARICAPGEIHQDLRRVVNLFENAVDPTVAGSS